MAVSQIRLSVVAMAVATIFVLMGSSAAQDTAAPAPAPAMLSSAVVGSPSFAVGCAVAIVTYTFGSALRI